MTDQTEDSLFQYTGCGLDYIYLQGGYKIVQTPRGEGITIEDVSGLYEAIARAVISDPTPLQGQEIRFLRRRLRMTQDDLAGTIGVDKQTVGRWERDDVQITASSERMLRTYVFAHLQGDEKLMRLIEYIGRLRNVDEGRGKKHHTFDFANDGWHEAAVA